MMVLKWRPLSRLIGGEKTALWCGVSDELFAGVLYGTGSSLTMANMISSIHVLTRISMLLYAWFTDTTVVTDILQSTCTPCTRTSTCGGRGGGCHWG